MNVSPRPRKFDVWNDSWPKKPSNCETPAPNVSWLRFCSSNFSATSTLLSAPGVFSTLDRLAFERLEVAELVQPPDAVLERLGVEHAGLDQPHLAADDVVARRRVADEGDAVDEVLLALLDPHRDVDDRRPSARRRGRAAGRRIAVAARGTSRGLRSGKPVNS